MDNSELGLKPTSSYKATHDRLRTLVLRVYLLIYLLTYVHCATHSRWCTLISDWIAVQTCNVLHILWIKNVGIFENPPKFVYRAQNKRNKALSIYPAYFPGKSAMCQSVNCFECSMHGFLSVVVGTWAIIWSFGSWQNVYSCRHEEKGRDVGDTATV